MRKLRFAALPILVCALTLMTLADVEPASASSDAVSGASWTELGPKGDLPPAREGQSMVYDLDRNQLILFGGRLNTAAEGLDDTWAYDPVADFWTELMPEGVRPPARSGQSMVYDSLLGRTMLFGGWSLERDYNDLWAYDAAANAWTELKPIGALPAPRTNAAMVYDPGGERVLMFGGYGSNTLYNDLWAYDSGANSWSMLTPSGDVPPARRGPSAVFVPDSHSMFLFGGWSGEGDVCFNDLWVYDLAGDSWTELQPVGALPPPSDGHSIVYDPVLRQLVLFGAGATTAGGASDDVWVYAIAENTWIQVSPVGSHPSARLWRSMVYEPDAGRVILFGGGYSNDTWAYEASTNTWTELDPDGALPAARTGAAVAYAPDLTRAILFGGWDGTSMLADTWAYDSAAGRWTQLRPSGDLPPARGYSASIVDPDSGRVVVFGGEGSAGPRSDMWAYDPGADTWTELHPDGESPPGRKGSALVYEPQTRRMLLFGGRKEGAWLNDIWAYDSIDNRWTELQPRGELPPARGYHSMAYHESAGRLVLYGGLDDNGVFDDTWAYDPATSSWEELDPGGSIPAARAHHSLVYGPGLDAVILFGGRDAEAVFDDTWAYDPVGNTWVELDPSDDLPSGRGSFAMFFDPAAGRMVLFGGVRLSPEGTALFNDTWALALPMTIPAARSGFVALPTEISRDPVVIGTNVALALIFALMFGFTSTLFNNTLRAKYAEITGAFGFVGRLVAAVRRGLAWFSAKTREGLRAVVPWRSRRRGRSARGLSGSWRWLKPLAIVLVTGLVYAFLDPNFGVSSDGLWTFISRAASVAVVTSAYKGVQALVSTHRYHMPAMLRFFPAAIAIAVFCVLVSRLVGFKDGYLYGFVGGLVFLGSREPDERKKGRLILMGSGCLLVISLAAWFLAVPLKSAADAGSSWLGILQGICEATFIAGLEGLFFGLIPLRFMDGWSLFRWNKWVWTIAFAAPAFLFWHVLLNRRGKLAEAFGQNSAKVVIGLLAFWTLATLGMYIFFVAARKRSTKESETPQ